jgi:hypothetical protein
MTFQGDEEYTTLASLTVTTIMLDVGVEELEGDNSLEFVLGRLGKLDNNVIKFVGNVLRGSVLG